MKDTVLIKSFYILLICSVFIIMLAFYTSNFESVTVLNEDVIGYNEGWHYINESGEEISLTLPNNVNMPAGSVFKITNTLPNDYADDMTFSIYTALQTLRVSINNNILYEFGFTDGKLFHYAHGSTYHLIRLPADSAGKEISLELTSKYQDKIGELSSIVLGSKSGIFYHIISNQLIPFVICLFIFLIGLVYLFIYIYMNMVFKNEKSLLYLGLFAILVSIWSATETKLLHFLIPYTFIVYIITYLSLMLCPIPFLLFLKGAFRTGFDKLINVLCITMMVNFVISNSLAFMGIFSYREMLPIIHVFLICVLLLSIIIVAKEVYYKNKDVYTLGLSIAILILFTSFELGRFYIHSSADSSLYFRFGLLIFTLLVGLSTIKKLIGILQMGLQSKAIHKLAYMDVLTGIKNRTAFEKDIALLNKSLTPKSNIITIMFDLNNLKETNDQHGHKAGDSLLINAATCIKNAFEGSGECYRIGGDEFAVILLNIDEISFHACLTNFDLQMDNFRHDHNDNLQIAYGYAHYSYMLDVDLNSTLNRSDQLMYESKAKMKVV